MSLTTLRVHITNRSEKTVYITRSLLADLQLSGNRMLRFSLGKRSLEAPIRILRRAGNHLYLPAGLQRQLLVPSGGMCYAVRDGVSGLRLGPLIGLMTSNRPPSRRSTIRPYILAGHRKSFYCAFHPNDVNWTDETMSAYFITSSGGWTKKTVPLPDVVYNRMGSRRSERLPSMEALKERFQRRGIPIFNWNFFDKSEVYALLSGEPEAEQHVPESITSPTYQQVKEMLNKYHLVYLKPTSGSLGRGIMRLTYKPRSGYYLRYRSNGHNTMLKFNRFAELRQAISRRTASLSRYVCQQGIRLIEIDRCPIDFRFHLNKNHSDQWVVAGIGAKKAGRGSVTTHLRNGGKLLTPEQALTMAFGSRAGEILEKAKRESIKLAEVIERKSRHRVGEIGFDIGIDKNGVIWMFEANAKPGRSIFKHPALKQQGKQSLRYIFEHCMYLSKFRSGSED
jgi:hypothetical protein